MEVSEKLRPLILPGFWSGREHIANAIVNGLLGSGYLLIFWTPLVIGLALPLEVATLKTSLCWLSLISKDQVQGMTQIPPNLINEPVAESLLYDNSQMYPMNTVAIVGFVLFSAFLLCLCFYLAHLIIKSAGLDWYYVMKFNLVMAIIISIIEGLFFIFVALSFNPYNASEIYQKSMAPVLTSLQNYIDISPDSPVVPVNPFPPTY